MKIVYNSREREFDNAEAMLRKLGFNQVDDADRERLRRAERSGRVLHVGIDPFTAEMGAGEDPRPVAILIADSQEELDRIVAQRAEDI